MTKENEFGFKYRVDLEYNELLKLQAIMSLADIDKNDTIAITLNEMILNAKKIKKSYKKSMSAETATEARTEKAKKHIRDAVDYIKRNDIKMTQSAVVEYSKCSVNTVKKYKYLFT